MVRDPLPAIERQKAELGIASLQSEPTRGMIEEVQHPGSYTHQASATPRMQIITIGQLLAGVRPKLPRLLPASIQAPVVTKSTSGQLF